MDHKGGLYGRPSVWAPLLGNGSLTTEGRPLRCTPVQILHRGWRL